MNSLCMIIARHTNEPISAIKALPPCLFLEYAQLSLSEELGASSLSKDERAEWIEEYIYGTDYSGRRDLRALLDREPRGR